METNQPEPRASRWRTFGLRFEKMLANLVNDLHLLCSMIIAKWIIKRELKRQATRQSEVSYEAKKHKLLVALRRKISERRSKQ
jgi:hypothetical protein